MLSAGVDATVVSGTRALDETRVGMAAGLTGAVAVLLTGAYHTLSPWGIWVWGIALPMTVAGLAAHYSTRLISQWKLYWQTAEKQRCAPSLLMLSIALPIQGLFLIAAWFALNIIII